MEKNMIEATKVGRNKIKKYRKKVTEKDKKRLRKMRKNATYHGKIVGEWSMLNMKLNINYMQL